MKKRKGKPTRVMIMSDLHCGNVSGIVPKHLWQRYSPFYHQQRTVWNFYNKAVETVKRERPVDLLVVNGDAIDGKGEKAGGTEIFLADRQDQYLCAKDVIDVVEAKEHHFTFGTPYHTGKGEDWERPLAEIYNAPIDPVAQFSIHGIGFNVKHKVGASQIHYNRANQISKERLNNLIWADYNGQLNARIVVRSHTHGFIYAGDHRFLACVTPGMQGFGSKYGSRQAGNLIAVGFIIVDVYPNGTIDFDWFVMPFEVVVKRENKIYTSYETRLKEWE